MIHLNRHGGNRSILRMLNESLAAAFLNGPQPLSPVVADAANAKNGGAGVMDLRPAI
jgi:hypothetical protein